MLPVFAVQAAELSLSWTDNSTNELGFLVERRTNDEPAFVLVGTTAADVTTFSDFTLTPGQEYWYRVCAYNEFGESDYAYSAAVTIQPQPPTLSRIENLAMEMNQSTGELSFVVTAADSPASALQFLVSSSDPHLFPDHALILAGSGNHRSLTLVPAPGRMGSAIVTITVSDGLLSTSESFWVDVLLPTPAPTISAPTQLTLGAYEDTGAVPFSVSDEWRDSNDLIVTAASSNPELLPDDRIMLGGQGSSRWFTLFPVQNVSGSSTVTLTVSNGEKTAQASVVVTVTPPVVAPPAPPVEQPPADPLPSLPIDPGASSRLVNLSVRSTVMAGPGSMVVGFVVSGDGSKSLLMRAVGPTLSRFGVPNYLKDSRIEIHRLGVPPSEALVGINDNWQPVAIPAGSAAQGAFALPAHSLDSALLLPMPAGAYTIDTTGKDSDAGMALVELYDADSPDQASTATLSNVSVRTQIGTGDDVVIVGFVVSGNAPKRLLIRGVGPELSRYGLSGALPDPQLSLLEVTADGSRLITEADDVSPADGVVVLAAGKVGAFPLEETSRSAALVVWLVPGAYTAVVRSGTGGPGIGLVELYDIP